MPELTFFESAIGMKQKSYWAATYDQSVQASQNGCMNVFPLAPKPQVANGPFRGVSILFFSEPSRSRSCTPLGFADEINQCSFERRRQRPAAAAEAFPNATTGFIQLGRWWLDLNAFATVS